MTARFLLPACVGECEQISMKSLINITGFSQKKEPSLLLQLPLEIRIHIFEYVFADAVSIHAEYHWLGRVKCGGLTCFWTPSDTIDRSERKSYPISRWYSRRFYRYIPFLRRFKDYALFTQLAHRRYCQLGERDRFGAISDFAILRTCRQIHNEARHLPYRVRMFDFYDFDTMMWFFGTAKPSCISNIRRLSVDCNFMEMRVDNGAEAKMWNGFCASVPSILPHLKELQVFAGKRFPEYYYWQDNLEERLQLEDPCWQSLLTLRKLSLSRLSLVMTDCRDYFDDEMDAVRTFAGRLKDKFLPFALDVTFQWM